MVSGGGEGGREAVFGVPGARGVFSAQFGPGETELIFWGVFTLFSCSMRKIFVCKFEV